MGVDRLRVVETVGCWVLTGSVVSGFELVNDFLSHLADRNYAPGTCRGYAYDLLHFARWLDGQGLVLDRVTTGVVMEYLAACRTVVLPGQAGGNVVSLRTGRAVGYAPATINRRLAAISGVFGFAAMRDPLVVDPVPQALVNRPGRRARGGELAHLAGPVVNRSRLRVRQPRRLPRGLDRGEITSLLGSFRCDRDRAIAGLMLFSGLRSCEVLGLRVRDVDIGQGWVRVLGKGAKERRVPLDRHVGAVVQAYLLAERPDSQSTILFLVGKGPHRGQPLTSAGLRTVFRYHRDLAGVPAGHPHALRHTFGTALAEAGVDLAVLRELMGHDHVDSSAAYIHLAPVHVRRQFDAANQRPTHEHPDRINLTTPTTMSLIPNPGLAG